MERKYYLRGLGLGIAMTAIIMGVALPGNKTRTMTDEEIIARAKELGMVENTVLADIDSEDAEDDAADDSVDDPDSDPDTDSQQNSGQVEPDMPVKNNNVSAAGDENEEADNAGEGDASDVSADETADAEDGEQEDIPEVIDNRETDPVGQNLENNEPAENVNEIITSAAVKTITVNSGDGSYTVARKLADVGVVTSAETFDTFLCQNGYDKRLRTGTYSIPADASDEQIARIVTGAE